MYDVDRRNAAGLDVVGLQGQHPWRSAKALSSEVNETPRHCIYGIPISIDQNQAGLCDGRTYKRGYGTKKQQAQ